MHKQMATIVFSL